MHAEIDVLTSKTCVRRIEKSMTENTEILLTSV